MTHPFAWMDNRMWNPDDPKDMAELAEAERQREEYDRNISEETLHSGGPAFPTDGFNYSLDHGDHQSGMSLRDWFAGQALAGTLAQGGLLMAGKFPEAAARDAYSYADAMLAARRK